MSLGGRIWGDHFSSVRQFTWALEELKCVCGEGSGNRDTGGMFGKLVILSFAERKVRK